MSSVLKIHSKVATVKESATLRINQKAKLLRAQGKDITHFGFGESPFPVYPKIQEALKKNTHHKEYLPSFGLPELRKTLSQFLLRRFNHHFSESQVCIGPGSKELLFQVLFALEGPVILPAPSWVSYAPQARLLGKHVEIIQTRFENRYVLQANQLDICCRRLGSQQKILILNSPGNPTGTVYNVEELKALAKICKQHNVLVISDEIYAEVLFDKNKKYASMAHHYPEGTLVTGGLSKAYSAGGWRLGYLGIPETLNALKPPLQALISETFSCVSAPIQYAAITAFEMNHEIEKYVESCTQTHHAASDLLYNHFVKLGLRCPKPEGAFYLFPDFQHFASPLKKQGITTSEQLCHHLLEQYHLAVLPGSEFLSPPDALTCRVASVDYNGAHALSEMTDGNNFVDFKSFASLRDGCHKLQVFLLTLSEE